MMRRLIFIPLTVLLALSAAACGSLPDWAGGAKKPVERLPGERLSVLKSAAQLQADASLADAPVDIPGAEMNLSWAQHGGNAQARMTNLALPESFASRQSASAGEGAGFSFKLSVSPVAAEGAVFAMDAAGRISAHDMKQVGEVRWISPGVATDEEEPVMGGGLAYERGRVFAASGKGLVAAFDAQSGVEVWRQALNIPIRSAPRVDDGRVYVITVDSQLYALDAHSGAVLWSHRGISEGQGFLIDASPTVAGELVMAPYPSGEIHVLRVEDGSEVWTDAVMGPQQQSALSVFTGIGGDPVIADGVAYVAGSAGMFAAFHLETGRRLWDQPVSSIQTPWVAGDYVFVLATDGQLVAFNRFDGRVRWAAALPRYADEETKKEEYSWSGPVMAGGRLLVAGAHGQMLAISPQDGNVLASLEIPSGVRAAPIIAGGAAYLVTDEASLVALY